MGEATTLSIRHATTYSYETPVYYALQKLRLTPRTGHGQRVVSWSCEVNGGSKQLAFDDPFNNHTDLVKVDDNVTEVEIVSEGIVEVEDRAGVVGKHTGYAPLWLFQEATALTAAGNQVRQLASQVRQDNEGRSELDLLHALSGAILEAAPYKIGKTTSDMTAEMAMAAGHGVCQDHAHIMIAVARYLGLPARYVSGYLLIDGQTCQDASHAWCEVWTESLGWVGFDVSNGICPDGRYVRVAIGCDYTGAAPVAGIRQGAGDEALTVRLQVQQ